MDDEAEQVATAIAEGRRPAGLPHADWDRAPWNRWSFQHVRELVPTVEVRRGPGPSHGLPRATLDLDALPVVGLAGHATALAAFLDETFTDGFLVLRHGAIVYERYRNDMGERTLHLSQSLAKSFVGALAGCLVEAGALDPVAGVTSILPALSGTAYAGASVRHLLDMTSGVRFTEDYTDPLSDMARADVASGWKRPRDPSPEGGWPSDMLSLVKSLQVRDATHGVRFSYRSIETDVLGMVLERVGGATLAELLSRYLWQPAGMEQDGALTVDSAGFALADGGLNACLRDYGRFGRLMVSGGGGIIPQAFIEATRTVDHSAFGAPYTAVLPQGGYRNQFWVEDPVTRNLMARGVFGQLIHMDFTRQIVVVKLSSWPEFTNPAWTRATLAAARRIGEALA